MARPDIPHPDKTKGWLTDAEGIKPFWYEKTVLQPKNKPRDEEQLEAVSDEESDYCQSVIDYANEYNEDIDSDYER